MLTREFTRGNPSNRLQLPAFIIAAFFFGLMVFGIIKTNWQISTDPPQAPTTSALAEQLFGQNGFILPLEIAAVLMLAVILGAIVIAREK